MIEKDVQAKHNKKEHWNTIRKFKNSLDKLVNQLLKVQI